MIKLNKKGNRKMKKLVLAFVSLFVLTTGANAQCTLKVI